MSSTDATHMPVNVGDLVRALPTYHEHRRGWVTVVRLEQGAAMSRDSEPRSLRLASGLTWRANAVEVLDRNERQGR